MVLKETQRGRRRKGVLCIKRGYTGSWTWELLQSNGRPLVSAPIVYSSKRNAVEAVDRLRAMLGATLFSVRVEE